MHFKHFTLLLTLLMLFGAAQVAFSQSQSALDLTLRYLEQNQRDMGLSPQDISDWVITDQYTSKNNGVTHLYMVQRHQGIKVHNAMITSNITPDGKVLYLNNKFVSNVAQKINTTAAGLTSIDAVKKAAQHLDVTLPSNLAVKENHSRNHIIYEKNGISLEPIHSELVYEQLKDGSLALAWDVYFAMLDGQHAWRMRLDAASGAILKKEDLVIHCNFSHAADDCDKQEHHNHLPAAMTKQPEAPITALNFGSVPNTYTVLAPPIESPAHGSFSMSTTIGYPLASPNGWHDDDTNTYTITRGNNVHAYQDRNNSNSSAGDEPDGGAALEFDFPFNQAAEPVTYSDAAVVNLFYWNNYIHDVFYAYGFDEASGNFQEDNFNKGGSQSDYVYAEAQDDAIDTTTRNNANFASGFSDGANGRMQMYLWDKSAAEVQLFTVNSPPSIAGSYNAGTATFGEPVSDIPLTGDMVLVDDGTGVTSDACDSIINGADLDGKIVMIDRGDCEFGFKALSAQNEGAIAVIICNNVAPGTVNMAPGADGPSVTIPLVSLSLDDCNTIKLELNNGINISLVSDLGGPRDYDGDFDNGIIIHEYGHGISTRLTGGPGSSCLNNAEQAGEGWSDFFGLVLTHEAGDTGADPRGIGTYVERADTDGGGIRRFRYSTDMSVNSQDYDDIRGATAPHPVGEVMASTLWDLYWNMIDAYGYDADIYNGTGGNNQAVQLVIDGLKMQGCSPGFLDARDAILAADQANNGGANYCLIWKTFARRGLGVDADQGSANDLDDGTPNFDSPEDCTEELKIRKTATANVTTDEDITYTITVINDSGQNLTGVTVTDLNPAGAYFVQGSITGPGGTTVGNVVTWNIGDMADDEELTLTYKTNPTQTPFTTVSFLEDFEDGLGSWATQDNNGAGLTWSLDSGLPNSGLMSAYASDPDAESDQGLQSTDYYTLNSSRPALMFSHYYETERDFDGGTVEFLNEANEYVDLGSQMIRNGYSGELTNNLVSGNNGFSGTSTKDNSYIETIVDMTDFVGQTGFYRFHMTSDDNTGNNGWFVDDVKIVNLHTIPGSDACITSNEISSICAQTPDGGTVVYEGSPPTSVKDVPSFEMSIFPNPTNSIATVDVLGQINGKATITVVGVDGKVVKEMTMNNILSSFNLDVTDLSAGIYMVRLTSEEGNGVTKLVIQ